MRPVRTVLVLLLALAWLPLTSHCQLEAIPGLEFLQCASETSAAGNDSDPCQDQDCCSIESARYQTPRHQLIVPCLFPADFAPDSWAEFRPAPPSVAHTRIPLTAPPALAVSWHFLARAAGAPRSPSVFS